MSVSDSLRVQVAAAIHETLCGLLCDDEKPEDHDYDAADRVLSLLALTEEHARRWTVGDVDLVEHEGVGVRRILSGMGLHQPVRHSLVHRFVGPWVPDDVQSGS